MTRLKTRLSRFGGDTQGSLSIEAAMMAPLLAFSLFLTFTVFDIFRYDSTNNKAAYTLGDLLSRETDPIDSDYIEGLKDIFDYMTFTKNNSWIRVTVVRYDGDDDEMKLLWSHGNGSVVPLTQATMSVITPNIPDMTEEDTVVVVETFMPHEMPFKVGIKDFAFKNVVVTRPRFTAQLLWDDGTSS